VWIGISTATNGVDVSQATYIDAFSCLTNSGFSYAIIRCYQSNGQVDPNGPHTVYNAWAGGMQHVDVYMFPCPTCGNAQDQVNAAVNYLGKYNAQYGMLWLDIEGAEYWQDQSTNRNFFEQLVSAAQNLGQSIGVYTSRSQWDPIMGLDYTAGSQFPLWYASYDGNPSFSDFEAFSGWEYPAIKQYNANVNLCGAGLDQNWYP